MRENGTSPYQANGVFLRGYPEREADVGLVAPLQSLLRETQFLQNFAQAVNNPDKNCYVIIPPGQFLIPVNDDQTVSATLSDPGALGQPLWLTEECTLKVESVASQTYLNRESVAITDLSLNLQTPNGKQYVYRFPNRESTGDIEVSSYTRDQIMTIERGTFYNIGPLIYQRADRMSFIISYRAQEQNTDPVPIFVRFPRVRRANSVRLQTPTGQIVEMDGHLYLRVIDIVAGKSQSDKPEDLLHYLILADTKGQVFSYTVPRKN